jgi:transcriptional regulator with XRE-family HTH domain
VRSSTFNQTIKALSASIKTRREACGLSQEALALDAGVDRTFVSQIERGVGNPSLRIVCLLADRLNAMPFELLRPDS